MQSSKKSKMDWEEDLYILYLQTKYFDMMTFEIFINFAKGHDIIEKALGYTWKEVEK